MKKRLAVLLAGCLVFSLSACSSSGNSEQPSQTQEATQEQEPTPIQVTTSPESSETEQVEEGQEQTEMPLQTADTKRVEKADVSGIYTDKQGTSDVYSELTLALQENGTYAVEIDIYRTGALRGTAVWEGDKLRFISDAPHDVVADISVIDDKAEMTVISDANEFLDVDVYSFADGAPEEQSEMKADELLDLFISGSIKAVDPANPTSAFYITDLNMDPEEWDSYSIGEKIDLDNDGENELILNGPYGGIYLDARKNQVCMFAAGEGNALTLSYTYYDGTVWIMYSNTVSTGYEYYHIERFEGADNLVAEMDFSEEPVESDNPESGTKYTLNGTEISYEEYCELSNIIFTAQVTTN